MEYEKRQEEEEELGHNMLALLEEAMTVVAIDCIVVYCIGEERDAGIGIVTTGESLWT